MNRSLKTCAASASAGTRVRRRAHVALVAFAAMLAAACTASAEKAAETAPPPPARAVLAVHDSWARAADSGGMTAVYFIITNAAAVSDTLARAESEAAEAVGIHMSMQQGNMMHMAELQSLPVPAADSVLFAPLGAHVMLTRTRRAFVAGDTIPLTLTFVSGQVLEVRAGVRQP